MLTSSTHDTKRSEDIRARLVALSEVAEVWAEAVRRWCSSNAHYWAPGSNDGALEYLCYQTLVGLLPASPPSPEERSALLERLVSYMLKAAREAKLRTSWTDQNSDFEAALEGFIRSIVWDEAFMADICGLVGVVQEAGWVNSLSMLALKLMAPGVPDIYQGCEVWDYSLVDPDNRRPVAFELLEQLLEKVISQPAPTWWSDPKLLSAGAPKIGLTHAGLQLRSRKPECFSGNGSYHAVAVEGVAQDHVIAFSRGEDIVVIAVRLPIGLASSVAPERAKGYYSSHETLVSDMARAGSETMVRLAEGEFVDICTGKAHHGGAVSVQELLSALPVAILERRSTEEGQQSTT